MLIGMKCSQWIGQVEEVDEVLFQFENQGLTLQDVLYTVLFLYSLYNVVKMTYHYSTYVLYQQPTSVIRISFDF